VKYLQERLGGGFVFAQVMILNSLYINVLYHKQSQHIDIDQIALVNIKK